MDQKKTLKPVNQKSVYHSFADLYEKLMNDEISVDKAEVLGQQLAGMNRTFALEIKLAELGNLTKARSIELKSFAAFPDNKAFDRTITDDDFEETKE